MSNWTYTRVVFKCRWENDRLWKLNL